MFKFLRITVSLLIIALVIALSFFGYFFYQYKVFLKTPINTSEQQLFVIENGQGFDQVADTLEKQQLIDNAYFYKIYGRLQNSHAIKAGEYLIPMNTTPPELYKKFIDGDINQYKITFIEGWTFKQMLDKIRQQDDIAQTLEFVPVDEITDALEINQPAEGLFFPDTYLFSSNTKDSDLLLTAYKRMQDKLNAAWASRSADNPLKNPYELLILASIIEKETGIDSERDEIAGVFIRRLEKNMPLQTDPTVIYGLGDNYDGTLNYSELKKDTPYNTYTRKGLPPTPIALPSEASLQAAAKPKSGKSLYFVADGKGGHTFTNTYKEHLKAVEAYRQQRSQNELSNN